MKKQINNLWIAPKRKVEWRVYDSDSAWNYDEAFDRLSLHFLDTMDAQIRLGVIEAAKDPLFWLLRKKPWDKAYRRAKRLRFLPGRVGWKFGSVNFWLREILLDHIKQE